MQCTHAYRNTYSHVHTHTHTHTHSTLDLFMLKVERRCIWTDLCISASSSSTTHHRYSNKTKRNNKSYCYGAVQHGQNWVSAISTYSPTSFMFPNTLHRHQTDKHKRCTQEIKQNECKHCTQESNRMNTNTVHRYQTEWAQTLYTGMKQNEHTLHRHQTEWTQTLYTDIKQNEHTHCT